MAKSRLWWLLSLSLTVAVHSTAWSQSVKPRQPTPFSSQGTENQPRSSVKSNDVTCKVYSLSELGSDPNLGQWVADTIPEVIQPGTWSLKQPPALSYYSPNSSAPASPPPSSHHKTVAGAGEAKRTLSYFAPAKVLVVCHTAEAHAQIAEFLQTLKKSLPQDKGVVFDKGVVQAQLETPAPVAIASDTGATAIQKNTAYPIPTPQQQPKHLFHFVIRYEGDGVLDSAVAGVVKKFTPDSGEKPEKSESTKSEEDKVSSLNQLFHIIVRYEGEGLIDSNVVEFMKAFQEQLKQEQRGNTPPAPSVPQSPVYYPNTPSYGCPPPGGSTCPIPAQSGTWGYPLGAMSQCCPTGPLPPPMVAPVPSGGNNGRMPLADETRSPAPPASTQPQSPTPPTPPGPASLSR